MTSRTRRFTALYRNIEEVNGPCRHVPGVIEKERYPPNRSSQELVELDKGGWS